MCPAKQSYEIHVWIPDILLRELGETPSKNSKEIIISDKIQEKGGQLCLTYWGPLVTCEAPSASCSGGLLHRAWIGFLAHETDVSSSLGISVRSSGCKASIEKEGMREEVSFPFKEP